MLQVGAIFHVVIGARALFPGSPVMPALEQRFGKNIGMQHFRIMQRLVELGAEVLLPIKSIFAHPLMYGLYCVRDQSLSLMK